MLGSAYRISRVHDSDGFTMLPYNPMGSIHADADRLYIRLERLGRDGSLFWEMIVAGCELRTRSGQVGDDGLATSTRLFSSHEAARREADARIAAQREQGFEAVEEDADPGPHQPDLAAAIFDHPDDDSGYLVYADWLQARGEPRGELISLEHGRARKPHNARVIRALRQFRQRYGRMLPARVIEAMEIWPPYDATCELDWHMGYIRRARFDKRGPNPRYTVRELVASLLTHPSALFLRELAIGALQPAATAAIVGTTENPPIDYRPLIQTIHDCAPPGLRTLHIAARDNAMPRLDSIELGDVSGLLRHLPRLETLHLCGGAIALEPTHAPSLRSIEILPPSLDDPLLRALDESLTPRADGRSSWPTINTLTLFGNGAAVPLDHMPGLLSARGVPAMHTLSITSTAVTVELWSTLAASPLLAQLENLDLSYGDLGDGAARVLLASSDAFAHLETLVLDGNFLSRAVRSELRDALPNARIHDQRGAAAEMPTITYQDVVDFSPDMTTLYRIGDVALPDRWRELAVCGAILWGRYPGSVAEYDVFADLRAIKRAEPRPVGCTCPSSKYPCKHTLGLMLIAEQGHTVPVAEPPAGFIERCRSSRYD